MHSSAETIEGGGDILLLCDHASAAVPDGVTLHVDRSVMAKHVAVDIGAADLTRALAVALDAPAILATVSRLVIDLHRDPDHLALIPLESDGHAIPGNRGADRFDRIARFHAPYHRAIHDRITAQRPVLLVAIHSFTRQLESADDPRPMHAGILYNHDDRAAAVLIAELRAAEVETGDNAPYSGRHLNATLNRHGEARGIACVSVEVRNDLIADPANAARWAAILAPMIAKARNRVASMARSTQ